MVHPFCTLAALEDKWKAHAHQDNTKDDDFFKKISKCSTSGGALHLPTPRRQLDFGCRPGHFDEPQIEKNSCVWSLSQSFKYRYGVQNRSSLVPLKTVKTDKKSVQIRISKFRIFFFKNLDLLFNILINRLPRR
jgi:hypothetical protein